MYERPGAKALINDPWLTEDNEYDEIYQFKSKKEIFSLSRDERSIFTNLWRKVNVREENKLKIQTQVNKLLERIVRNNRIESRKKDSSPVKYRSYRSLSLQSLNSTPIKHENHNYFLTKSLGTYK